MMRLLVVAALLVAAPLAQAQEAILYDPPEPRAGDVVRFATSHAGPWSWNFGDDSPLSQDGQPEHRFLHAGIYTVTLHAGNQSYHVEVPVHIPQESFADVDEASYRNGTGDSLPGNESLQDAPKESSPWSSTWALMALVLVGVGVPGAGLVYWKRRREDAAALDLLDEDDDPDELPLDAYSRSEQPALDDLEDLLPFEEEDEPYPEPEDEAEDDDIDPFLFGDFEDDAPEPPTDEVDEEGILAGLRLEEEQV